MEKLIVAIDGPAGAGKSTIAKLLAETLGITYIDTGAMYRAVGYYFMENGISLEENIQVEAGLKEITIQVLSEDILLNGKSVKDKIRTSDVSAMASQVAKLKSVREKLVKDQRLMGEHQSLVMDGRDIGTNVFKEANFKFFLTATPEERGRRRFLEFKETNPRITLDQVIKEVKERDYADENRTVNPLKMAEDGILIDNTHKTPKEVVNEMLTMIRK